MSFRAAVITMSDRSARGERPDLSGPAAAAALAAMGAEVAETLLLPDEEGLLVTALERFASPGGVDVVVISGGTGLGPRDRTPEAVARVAERQVPGIAEALRAAGMSHTPLAALSRQVAAVRGRTLIVALPGSPRAVAEGMAVLRPLLSHAAAILGGRDAHEGQAGGAARPVE